MIKRIAVVKNVEEWKNIHATILFWEEHTPLMPVHTEIKH